MKRETEELNLRNAFGQMPEACRDALMTAARSVEEEKPVKRFTARTVLIAACIIIATMAIAVAAGKIFGWTDFYSENYGTVVPDAAQKVMQDNGETTWELGPVTFTTGGLYCDGRMATASTVVRLKEGNEGLLTSDPFDTIGAIGENGDNVAKRLGVDPKITWAAAAKQLNIPLYSVRAILEVPEEYAEEAMEDPMYNEDGSMTYFSMPLINGRFKGDRMDCTFFLRVQEVDPEDPEGGPEALKDRKEISIPVSGPIDTKEYTVPGEITIMDAFRLDSARAELMPGGVYLTCACTALDASAEDTDDREETASMLYELRFRQEDGNEFPAGMDLSTRIKGIDGWPVVEREELLSVNEFPEKIVLILPDEAETKITLELKE